MRLNEAADYTKVEIVSIKGGGGISSKLRQLVLMPGDQITITNRAPFRGPLIVEANGRSVALGRGVAGKVEVRLCE